MGFFDKKVTTNVNNHNSADTQDNSVNTGIGDFIALEGGASYNDNSVIESGFESVETLANLGSDILDRSFSIVERLSDTVSSYGTLQSESNNLLVETVTTNNAKINNGENVTSRTDTTKTLYYVAGAVGLSLILLQNRKRKLKRKK